MRVKTGAAGLCVGSVMLIACDQRVPEPTLAQRARQPCGQTSSATYYFPSELFYEIRATDDERYRTASSMLLASADEPPLSCGDAPHESYRFMWTHAFNVSPLIVRVTNDGSIWRILGIRLNSFSDRTVAERKETVLRDDQGRALRDLIDDTRFWTTPRSVRDPIGYDGDTWILEGRRDSGYHLLHRWGVREGPILQLGLALVKLSGISAPDLFLATERWTAWRGW
jgi:hypothetical protein